MRNQVFALRSVTAGLLLLAACLACSPVLGGWLGASAPTAVPSATQPAPTSTQEPSPLPTDTVPPPTSTASPPPTTTGTPTELPSEFSDDFSQDDGNWADCRKCSWEQGMLLMGPYAPALDQDKRLAICVPCGQPKFFRIAVDVTHIEGETDRGYGLLFWDNDQTLSIYEISPLYLLTLAARYDRATRMFEILNPNWDQLLTGLVRPGKAVNHLEVEAQPNSPATTNVFFKINGHTAFVLYNKAAVPGKVGFSIDYHAVQVGFDNFEFEVIEP